MEECTNTVLIRKVLQPRNIRDGSVLQNLQSKINKGGLDFVSDGEAGQAQGLWGQRALRGAGILAPAGAS